MITEKNLSEKALEDFERILKKYSETEFSKVEVESMASNFLQYFGKIYRPIPKEKDK